MATIGFDESDSPRQTRQRARTHDRAIRQRLVLLAIVVPALAAAVALGSSLQAGPVDAELATLLRGMAAIKAAMALLAIGLVGWRAGAAVTESRFLAYALTASALAFTALMVVQLKALLVTSLLFHATLVCLGLLALGDATQALRKRPACRHC